MGEVHKSDGQYALFEMVLYCDCSHALRLYYEGEDKYLFEEFQV